jgi:hypothetical protein
MYRGAYVSWPVRAITIWRLGWNRGRSLKDYPATVHNRDRVEALYQNYKHQGFMVLGFPCNQFGRQEPGTNEEIKQFCSTKYQVNFPLFDKIEVNGKNRHALYEASPARHQPSKRPHRPGQRDHCP